MELRPKIIINTNQIYWFGAYKDRNSDIYRVNYYISKRKNLYVCDLNYEEDYIRITFDEFMERYCNGDDCFHDNLIYQFLLTFTDIKD